MVEYLYTLHSDIIPKQIIHLKAPDVRDLKRSILGRPDKS